MPTSKRSPSRSAKPAKPGAAPRGRGTTPAAGLVRMGQLSRLSGVPASTIKHYLREGLLPGAAVSAARNSALYDPALVTQIRRIKDLQSTHFLPLWRVKEVIEGKADPQLATVAAAVGRARVEEESQRHASRGAMRAAGLRDDELDALVRLGLVPADDVLTGDDLELAETVIRAHRTGITAHLSTVAILERYLEAVRALTAEEVSVFASMILPRAGEALATQTTDAMKVSERLVVLIRRKLLLPVLEQITRASAGTRVSPRAPSRDGDKKKRPDKPASADRPRRKR